MALTEMLLGAFIWFSLSTTINAQYRPNYPSPYLQREIFVLNLEDGFFGCQVNESVDILQLFELSKLCDGIPQCFLGSDEVANELKCTDRNFCHPKMPRCINGVCLDNLCYCNDGFGGKGCEMPDENECKYRPCDVFAHCTNTMGSFYCSCFPGYEGDGFECHDINECEIPSLAAICVDNAECCNLPGHYVCKCGPGYTGNATVACTDINECLDPHACGTGAQCENIPGSYKCFCPLGYDGDPFRECYDLDECRRNPCGAGAQCTNTKGGYTCSCPRGYQGNPTPEAGCVDVDECWGPKPPCGKGAQCVNTKGGYYCQCPEGYTGNPTTGCVDINECPHACGANAECTNTPGSYTCRCKAGHTGDPYLSGGCHDEDECLRPGACGQNAQCFNNIGSYTCSCLEGYTGNPLHSCVGKLILFSILMNADRIHVLKMLFVETFLEIMNVNVLMVMMVMHVKHAQELKLMSDVKEITIVLKMLIVLETNANVNKVSKLPLVNVLILMNAGHQIFVDEMQYVKILLATTDVNVDMDMKRSHQPKKATVEILMNACLDASHVVRMQNV